MSKQLHTPVLLDETLDLLNLRKDMNVVDCTLGLGGHSIEMLKRIGAKGRLMGFDADENNLAEAESRIQASGIRRQQFILINSNFEHLKDEIEENKFPNPDAILFDLGFSSPHVDDPERGFSFQKKGPLDMRYDQNQKLTAEIVVNSYKEKNLADIIYKYGEERRSRVIARRIVESRKKKRITTTLELAEIAFSTVKGYQKIQLLEPSRHSEFTLTGN